MRAACSAASGPRSWPAISAPARSTAPTWSRTSSTLNPANTYFDKYYNLFSKIDTEPERFLEFERWWGGFFLMGRQEIKWIVENLFVGNNLADGDAEWSEGRAFDLRAIQTPIIVFASLGDNITPPQQAFNWVADIYPTTEALKANGQVIVGLMHQERRPSRHLRLGCCRQARAHPDRRPDRVHRASAAGSLRHAGRGAEDERECALRRAC